MERNTHVKKFSLAATRSNDPVAVVRDIIHSLDVCVFWVEIGQMLPLGMCLPPMNLLSHGP